jgi:endosialidase-like protein
MATLFANNVAGTLSAGVGPSDTALLLGVGQGASFPTPSGGNTFWVTVVHQSLGTIEIMKCTARSADTLTVVRGQDSTTAISFTTGSVVELRLVAQALRDLDYVTVKGVANGLATLDGTGKIPTSQIPTTYLTVATAAATYIPLTQRAAANGVATLDASTKIPVAQIPSLSATYIAVTQKAAASGVASLDASTKVPVAQIPDLSATYLTKATPVYTGNLSGSGTATSTNHIAPLHGSASAGVIFYAAAGTMTFRPNGSGSATGQATLSTAGLLLAVDMGLSSDLRLKDEVVYYTPEPDLVDLLKPATWRWKHGGGYSRGLIAQDVESIDSRYVREGEDGMLSIDKAQLALDAVIGLASRVRRLESRHA